MTGAMIVLFIIPEYWLHIGNSTPAKWAGRTLDLDELVINGISYVVGYRQFISPNNITVFL